MKSVTHIGKQLSRASMRLSLSGPNRISLHFIGPIFTAIVIATVGFLVHQSVERAMENRLAGELTLILNANIEALRIWRGDQIAVAKAIANDPRLQPIASDVIATAAKREAGPGLLQNNKSLTTARQMFRPILADLGLPDFVIVSPSMEVVAAVNDAAVGSKFDGYRKKFFEEVLAGKPNLSRPFRSGLILQDVDGQPKPGLPTMFTAAPIPGPGGKPIGVLGLRILPEKSFTEILRTARYGESGETFAFTDTGLLLSQSRFDAELKRLGLLADVPDSKSILTLEARDPQVNMSAGERPGENRADQPVTQLIKNAVETDGGLVLEPYRDYRGVPSVGASKWIPEFDFGIGTEVNLSEALGPLYVLRRAMWGLIGLLSACGLAILLGTLMMAKQQQRVRNAERTVTQLGQYSLQEKIGSGGMGSVYRASHAFLRRPTAVKMLDAKLGDAEGFARFEREVQLTAGLNHPNTIAVYDYGRSPDGVFYYAMELLEGINLQDLVDKDGPLPEGRVVHILEQICGSLAEAHAIGLVHRDIKPANIILTLRAGIPDFVKVLDFGLAKAAQSEDDAKITQANVTLGTPHYMSPEAVEHPESVSLLSDVYAVGAVGYFLLTGTTVFRGKTVMDICMKQVRGIPDEPSKRLGRPVNACLESFLLRCLAKAPNDRPASAAAAVTELRRCQLEAPWNADEARDWWSAFKATAAGGQGSPSTQREGGATQALASDPARIS
jgi:hypothetical protein